MAEVRESITVVFKNTELETLTPVATEASPNGTSAGVSKNQFSLETLKATGEVASGLVAAQQIKPYVEQVIGFGVSQIQATTGSAEVQQRAQIISSGVSSVSSILLGAAIGGIPGAAMTAALTAIQSTMSFVQNNISIGNQHQIERENISRRKSVYGQSVNRSRNGGVS